MKRFADSNILCRYVELNHADHKPARDFIASVIERGETLLISPQIEREFWAVATRTSNAPKGGLGMTPIEAWENLRDMREGFLQFVSDSPRVHETWQRLVNEHSVTGVRAHDAAIAAAALSVGADQIVTFNQADFDRFEGEISVKTPQQLLQEFAAGTPNAGG